MVQQEVEAIQKTRFNEQQRYHYAAEADFISAIKPLLGEHKLAILPAELRVHVRDTQYTNGSPAESAYIELSYRIVDVETGEEILVPITAGGKDQGDKALPKAITMANKYMLAKVFQIETSLDDPDREDVKPEKSKPAPKPKESAPKELTADEKFAQALAGIKTIKSRAAILQCIDNINMSKLYTQPQKDQLLKLLSLRLDALDNPPSA